MKINEINPYVRLASVTTLDVTTKDDTFNVLKTPDNRLFFIIDGSGKIVIGTRARTLLPGRTVFIKAGEEYIWQPNPNSRLSFITINFDFTENFSNIKKSFHPIKSHIFKETDVLEKINFSDSPFLNSSFVVDDAEALRERFHILTTEYYMGGAYCSELLSSVLKSIILSLIRFKINKASVQNTKDILLAKQIIEYIQSHYSEEISNETIAETFNYNPVYLNRVFKRTTGSTLHNFMINYRLSVAMNILSSKNISISEIAAQVGFNDVPHFSKCFKKYSGLSPIEYKKK